MNFSKKHNTFKKLMNFLFIIGDFDNLSQIKSLFYHNSLKFACSIPIQLIPINNAQMMLKKEGRLSK